MFNKKNILKDLPMLLKQGIVDEESSAKLEAFYLQKAKESAKLSHFGLVKSLALYLIGAIFVIIGAYMFIDYNWSVFPNPIKLILMLAPLLVSVPLIVYALKNRGFFIETIALAVNFSGLVLALLAPSVIYNASGSYLDFWTTLVFLFCPLLVLFKHPLGLVLGAILLIFLKTSICDYRLSSGLNLSSFCYLLFFAIFAYQALRGKERLSYPAAAKLFAIFFLIISFMVANFTYVSTNLFIVTFALACFALYKGREILLILSMVFSTFVLGVYSSYKGIDRRSGIDAICSNDVFLSIAAGSLVILGVLAIVFAIYKRKKLIDIAISCLLFAHLLVFVILPQFKGTEGFDLGFATKILCNVSILALFGLLFARGIKEKSLLFLNEAFAVIIAYACFKLGDNYWSLAGNSALFVVIGIAMIASNKFLNRKIKQNEAL